jgi:hypothetical protein
MDALGETAVRKSWVFRYQRDKRRRMMGLGPTHVVSLAEARDEQYAKDIAAFIQTFTGAKAA